MPLAFRRPAQPGEIDAMIGLFKKARQSAPSFEAAIKIPLIAVLTSPHFLYLVEAKPFQLKSAVCFAGLAEFMVRSLSQRQIAG